MPVKLITGATGDGKSHYAVKLIKEALLTKRPVYTNIEGIDLDGVMPIPENDHGELDWQLCQSANAELGLQGALVVYDEAQKQKDNKGEKYFAWKGREKLSTRDVISELDTHRHFGYDIIFITQEPNLLHLHLLGFVKEHYHCSRPMNKQGSQIALWRSWQRNPNSSAALERAEDVFFVPFDKEVFEQYKSTELVTDKKLRIPKYIKKTAIIGLCAFAVIGLLFAFVDNPIFNLNAYKAVSGDKEGIEQMKKYMPKDVADQMGAKPNGSNDLNIECRKGVNVEKPECVEWFNNLSKSGGSISDISNTGGLGHLGASNTQQSVKYDPSKPYDLDDVQKSVSYQVVNKPKFSGCFKYNGQYQAYTEQGTKLNVSSNDCKKIVEQGDRPYDYFSSKEQKNQSSFAENKEKTQNKEMTSEQYLKYLEYKQSQNQAQNFVEERLERRIEGANAL